MFGSASSADGIAAATSFTSTSPSSTAAAAAAASFLSSAVSSIPLELLQAELLRRQDGSNNENNASPSSSSSSLSAPPAPSPTKPECGTKGIPAEYSVSSHVFALVLILVLSTVACAFPILARRFPKLPIPHHFLFLSRHFGTGVLIATAFVHLLPTAFASLSDPCLPDFWTKRYPPMPGFIAMLSVLAVVGIEMFFAAQGAGHVHGGEFDQAPMSQGLNGGGSGAGGGGQRRKSYNDGEEEDEEEGYEFGRARQRDTKYGRGSRPRGYSEISEEHGHYHQQSYGDDVGMSELDKLQGEERNSWGGERTGAMQNGLSKKHGQGFGNREGEEGDNDDDDLELDLDELDPHGNGTADDIDLLPSSSSRESAAQRKAAVHQRNESMVSTGSRGAMAAAAASSPAMAQRLLLQCVLLEAGILFHSVFIGMAVSVARGPAFVVLLVAIAFHQTFEGFALGARISAIVPLLPQGSPRPWLMALAYGTTTPLGQAVGLAIHGLYDPKSEAGLILVGCMNAISSGLLLFAGLVELLAEDFLSEHSYRSLRGRRRLEACLCVVAGALLMAAVGAFA